jgi:uncharacterized phage-like protein YoqJ
MIINGVCCFTGHRDFERTATEREKQIFAVLMNNLIGIGYNTFKAGGAIGFDTYAAEYILRRRDEGAAIRLDLVLPCADQASRWSPSLQKRYESILRRADSVECLHPLYTTGCMHERNHRMVNLSDACVAYCNRPEGGSYSTLLYAQKQGLSIFNICSMSAGLNTPAIPGEPT